jgi:hypothetical protein
VKLRPQRLATGERPLASTTTEDGATVAGTRDALHLDDLRIPWEVIEKADWDADSSTLKITEVGTWGEVRPVHKVVVADPGRLLQLVRERVTASVVLQRHVPVHGRRGLFVIARRAPRGNQPLQWVYEFQEGVDPDDPAVRRAAEAALEQARHDVGLP